MKVETIHQERPQKKEKKKQKPFENINHDVALSAHFANQQLKNESAKAAYIEKSHIVKSTGLQEITNQVERCVTEIITSDKTELTARYSSRTDFRLKEVEITVTKYATQPQKVRVTMKAPPEGLTLLTAHKSQLEKHLKIKFRHINVDVDPIQVLKKEKLATQLSENSRVNKK